MREDQAGQFPIYEFPTTLEDMTCKRIPSYNQRDLGTLIGKIPEPHMMLEIETDGDPIFSLFIPETPKTIETIMGVLEDHEKDDLRGSIIGFSCCVEMRQVANKILGYNIQFSDFESGLYMNFRAMGV